MCIYRTIYNDHNGLIKNSYFSGHLLLIDFSKAFDMVEHSISFKKLEKSYSINRKQFVSVNGSYSAAQTVKHGIPQLSMLGPLLLLCKYIYI